MKEPCDLGWVSHFLMVVSPTVFFCRPTHSVCCKSLSQEKVSSTKKHTTTFRSSMFLTTKANKSKDLIDGFFKIKRSMVCGPSSPSHFDMSQLVLVKDGQD